MTAKLNEGFTSILTWMLSLEEVSNEDVKTYCTFGKNISMAIHNTDAWQIFQQLYIQYLMEQGCINEAISELEELAEMFPDNEEIQKMKKKYKNKRTVIEKQIVKEKRSSLSAFTERLASKTGLDNEFNIYIEQLKSSSVEELLSNAATCANAWVEEDPEYYGLLLKWYRRWYGVGLFGQDRGFINYFGGMYQYLKQNVDGVVQLYELLADYRSKLTLKVILQHWLTFHPDLRKNGRETMFEHYFDLDVIKCDENEVFVDCGCYDGETVKAFLRNYTRYKSIYSYELAPASYELAKANLSDVPHLYLRNAGVSDKNGESLFLISPDATDQAANRLHPNGNNIAKVVKLDDDIKEDITFIKMDIEGAECEALRGAEQQIRRNKPKLAISLYHKLSDLLEIPQLVKSYVPDYKLYLRHEGIEAQNFPFPTEYVLLATL